MKRHILPITLTALVIPFSAANAQFGIPIGVPSVPGIPNIGRGVAGKIVAIAMAEVIKELSTAEKQKRQQALTRAARSGNASWSSGSGEKSKKATYKASGPIQEAGGKKCQQVTETITLSGGRQATSTETVCFS